jgi:putative peptidoglycan lipid II flippase
MHKNLRQVGRSVSLTLSLGWFAVVTILATLAIHWSVITHLGIGVETDAFFAAMIVPQLLLVLMTSSLLHVLVPLLATQEEGDELRAELSGILLIVFVGALAAATVLWAFSPLWVRWLVPGFTREGRELTVALTRIQVLGLMFGAADCVLRAACRARRRFIWAEASTAGANVFGLLILMWALPRYGVFAAAWISILRIALPVLVMWPLVGGWSRPTLWSPIRSEALRRFKPLLLSGSAGHVTVIITRQLASLAPTGGLSLLSISQQFYGTVNTVKDKALVIPISPALAMHAKEGRWDSFRALYRQRVIVMGLASATGYLILILFGQRLMEFALARGGMTTERVSSLWWILTALGLAYISNALGQPIFAAFCARGDTKTPVRLAMIFHAVNIPTRAIMFWFYGLFGMAIIMSVSSAIALLVNLIFLERSIPAPFYSRRIEPGEKVIADIMPTSLGT